MPQKILVIEDESFLASLMLEILKRENFDVDLASDAEGGLEKLKKESFDIILLDLILPGMHGFQLLEKLKKEEKTKRIPVIIISNLGSQEEIQKGLQLGADAYLIKAHILPADLVNKIKEILQQKNP